MRSSNLASHALVLTLMAACGSKGDVVAPSSAPSNAGSPPGPAANAGEGADAGSAGGPSSGNASPSGASPGGASSGGAGSSGGSATGGSSSGAAPGSSCTAIPSQLVDFKELARQVHASVIGANPLAVDGTSVYFVFAGALMRVPIRGGPVTTMSKLSMQPDLLLQDVYLAVTSTSVILHYPGSNGSDELIVRIAIGDDSGTTLATSSGRVTAFGADEQTVYFVDEGGTKSVPAAGGSVKLLTDRLTTSDSVGFGQALAVVGSNLVATSSAQGGSVVAVPLQGGAPTTLASQQPNASFPMPCGSDICWWAGATPAGPAGTPGPGAIVRLDAGGNRTSLPQAPYYPWSLVFDGSNFFETVGCDVCNGGLVRIPAAGGPSVSMGGGTFVAIHDSCSYLSSVEGIWTADKSYVAAPAGQ